MAHLSSNIFARLETLRKWQEEQQERLLKQKTEQETFLSTEQKRLNEALDTGKIINSTPINSAKKLEPILEVSASNIDDQEIISPNKDFNELLHEKLNSLPENDIVVNKTNMSKPKKPFLKKGTGLTRFNLSKNSSLSNNSVQKPKITKNTKTATKENENFISVKSGVQEIIQRASWAKVFQQSLIDSPGQEHSLEQSVFERQLERELSLKNVHDEEKNSEEVKNIKKELQNERANYQNARSRSLLNDFERENYTRELKNELKLESKREMCLRDVLENDREINRILGKDPNTTLQEIDELHIFELLEEKALNSSFCSTSTVINKLLGLRTPVSSKPPIPNITIETPDHQRNFKDDTTWASEEESEKSDSSDSETSETISSINVLCMDAATNTDIPYPNTANTDLLRARLEELENEIETFRNENCKVNRLKNDLSKERNRLEKEMHEQRQQIEEERKKLNKEKQLLNDKYIREMKTGTKKEREGMIALKDELANVREELKLKESRYGASQARQRNQIRCLEKELSSLKAESDKLRTQNGKLQTQVQQINKKPQTPSDTKVLHEINKNLSLLTKQKKQRTLSENSSLSSDKENETEVKKAQGRKPYKTPPNKNPPKSNIKTKPGFDSIAKDYEREFGSRAAPPRMDGRPSSGSSDMFSDRSQNRSIASAERIERLLPDGTKEITYANGNIKSISGDKVTMRYYNGDIKDTNPETATVRYYYAEANIWHTTYAEDGLEILEFPDGQIEKRRTDGTSEISFPDGCVRCMSPTGTETVSFPDGTIVVNKQNGDKVLTMPNGQKEIHTSEHKRREYPDGTVKILYPDGTQETRYANGRIRLKDINGELIMDTADMGLNT